MDRFVIAFSGHRPHKLQSLSSVKSSIHDFLLQQLHLHPRLLVISGGALGVDQIAAEVCIDLHIPFVFVIPFPFNIFTARWSDFQRSHLRSLMHSAVKVYTVQSHFSMSGYQRRNEVMVDHCDLLCAIFNGSPGGTANCVAYARSIDKSLHIIRP